MPYIHFKEILALTLSTVFEGKIIADKLAGNDANLNAEYTDQFCGIPSSVCKKRIDVMLH